MASSNIEMSSLISPESTFGKDSENPFSRSNEKKMKQSSVADRSYMDEIEIHHREMAIDCPVSFVGMKKEPPKYPSSIVIQNSTETTSKGKVISTFFKTSGQEDEMKRLDEERERKERMKRYQDDLYKRKEIEEKMFREEEFLRTSLRGSKKLQGLEEKRSATHQSTGFVNPTYLVEEEEFVQLQNFNDLKTFKSGKIFDNGGPMLVVEDVVATLNETHKYLPHEDDRKEIDFIGQFVLKEEFQNLLKIHNKIVEFELNNKRFSLSDSNASQIRDDIINNGIHSPTSTVVSNELLYLLNKTHFKNFLLVHDKCIQLRNDSVNLVSFDSERRAYDEYLYDRASEFGEDSIKIVRINKTSEPLGATVRNEGDSVIIGRIVKGGVADKSHLLHEGDEILEINGTDVRGKSINEVSDLMCVLTGVLTFLINPNRDHKLKTTEDSIMHIRANFSYDPDDDQYIPCRELGMSFMKGDILHVLNQEDVNWWQAYREGEDDQIMAGLIPSKSFHEQREEIKQTMINDSKKNSKKKKICRCVKKDNKKTKNSFIANASENEILSYEEVSLYYPQPNRKRPIVLIGPPNVGRQEIRQRLMENDPERFVAAIPHTSRPRKEIELDGCEYHFIQRCFFEEDIAENKFVEYGEYEKHLFGTSMDAIRQVVNSGKMCILNFHPQSLKVLKASDLKPYVVFIASPNIEKLKQLRQKQFVKFTDDELMLIIEKARKMEDSYGHYFDMIIVNQDLDRSYRELLNEINRLELEPQWIPLCWSK